MLKHALIFSVPAVLLASLFSPSSTLWLLAILAAVTFVLWCCEP